MLGDALHTWFGYDRFRPGQEAVIRAIMADQPVLGVMPTGAGKSLCYQLPALLFDGLTIVVSPLVALMKDQVDQLSARGIAATFINSQVDAAERDRRLAGCLAGDYRLLYLAPERLRPGFLRRAQGLTVSLLAVDEAHCISQWGHDFRPDYLRLGEAAKALGAQRIAAFTATATPEVRTDITRLLGIDARNTYVFGFRRPNLRFDVTSVLNSEAKLEHLGRFLRHHPEQAGIVYGATRRTVEGVYHALASQGIDVGYYHAGLEDDERRRVQEAFMSGAMRVMVATNAFGMGVDRPDLRFVIHFEVPGSLESLYQEAGRAGRDGRPALCALLFLHTDTRIQSFFIDKREGVGAGSRQQLDRGRLEEIVRYAAIARCRTATLLDYFGEMPPAGPCDGCDVCLGGPVVGGSRLIGSAAPRRAVQRPVKLPPRALTAAEWDVLRKTLSAVARGDGRASASVVSQALVGASTPGVIGSGLVGTKSHGLLKGWSRPLLTDVIMALADAGCLVRVAGTRSHFRLTTYGREVMWQKKDVQLGVPPFGTADDTLAGGLPEPTGNDSEVLEALVTLRNALARELGLPAHQVCPDEALVRLCVERPATRQAMMRVRGMTVECERLYGERLRAVISGFPANVGGAP